ncbi:glucan biosynthesis protein [Marinobacter goseongensis]|uniref:glucan biosynthesis protein n=1 Tax=Marinobacter goseongensis TaxID=453838 RepID=UPI003D07587A
MESGSRLLALLLLPCLISATPAQAFEFSQVVEKAKELVAGDYAPPPVAPDFLRDLDYPEYQAIRFNPEDSLWRVLRSEAPRLGRAPGFVGCRQCAAGGNPHPG